MDGTEDGITYRGTLPLTTKGLDYDSLLDLARQQSPDPTVFDEEGEAPFFWRCIASNSKLDAYFTRMDDTSLKNYVEDAKAGIQFQVSHNGAGGGLFGGPAGEVGFGRSLNGRKYTADSETFVAMDFMTLPGLTCGNLSSDQFIRGTRAGIYKDVSIGFRSAEFVCNICGSNMLRWSERCEHYPGITYEVKEGKKTKRVLCFAWVKNAHCGEASIVYDGATPGAGVVAIEKARMMAQQGRLTERARLLLEQTYRVAVPANVRRYQVGGPTMEREDDETRIDRDDDNGGAPDPEVPAGPTPDADNGNVDDTVVDDPKPEPVEAARSADDPLATLRDKYAAHGIKLGKDPVGAVRVLAEALISEREVSRGLEGEAKDGRAYRAALIASLEKEAVRAMGAEAWLNAKDRWLRVANGATCEDLVGYVSDFQAQAAKTFPGGRITTEGTPPDGTEERAATPAHLVA